MGQCRHIQYILYLTVIGLLLIFRSISCTDTGSRVCRDPAIIPLNNHGSRDITEMSRYILPRGNDIIPGQGTLYRVEPQLINITYHTEFRLGSKEDYKTRNFPFGRTGAYCPWLFLKNIDDNRIPRVLYEAKCVLHKCIGNTLFDCKEVYSYINVVRRTRCVNGVYEYSTIVEPVAVGCTCVRRPRAIRRPTMHH